MTTMRDVEDKVRFCALHKVWYIEDEQPCKACVQLVLELQEGLKNEPK